MKNLNFLGATIQFDGTWLVLTSANVGVVCERLNLTSSIIHNPFDLFFDVEINLHSLSERHDMPHKFGTLFDEDFCWP